MMPAPPFPSVFSWPAAERVRELQRRGRLRHPSIRLRQRLGGRLFDVPVRAPGDSE